MGWDGMVGCGTLQIDRVRSFQEGTAGMIDGQGIQQKLEKIIFPELD